MFSHEAADYFTLENPSSIGGKNLEALQALRRIGIASVTERQQKKWAFYDKIEDTVQVFPWGVPNINQDQWAIFSVALKDQDGGQPARSISFERAAKEFGNYELKVFVSTRKNFDENPQHQWEQLEIRGIGNIFHMIIKFDEAGNITLVDGHLNELTPGVSVKKFHVDLIPDETEAERGHGNMDEVLKIVNQAMDMGDKPIQLNNLNPGLIITECLKPETPIDNHIFKAAIIS